ncbi:MAG: hypothetical protein JST58_13325 [Bacteroidetes bacterium]|nr:hypothetical protein [Bacteroidota bacterium]
MKYDYVVILKKSSEKQVDRISILLCLLSILAFTYAQWLSGKFTYPATLFSLAIAVGVFYNIFLVEKEKQPRYRYLLVIAGLYWFMMPYLQWVAFVLFFLAFLEYQAKHPLEVGFTKNMVVINSLIKKKYPWSAFNNIILKDGLLTLDFKNNTLFQKEALDDDEPDAEEDEFNDFCRVQLQGAVTENKSAEIGITADRL